MPQTRPSQMAVLILAGTLLASPNWAAAAPRPAGTTLSAAARIWLLDLFAKTPKPHPTPKAGCGIDPNGCR